MKKLANSIHEGDCIQVMSKWKDDSFDHCITDPPYNMSKKKGMGWAFSSHVTMEEEWDQFTREDYLEFTKAWMNEVVRLVKPNGNIFIFGSFHNIYDIGHIMGELNLKVNNSIVWFKPNAQPSIHCRNFTESTEHIIWAANGEKGKAKNWIFNYKDAKELNEGKQMRNLWQFPVTPKREKEFGKHPSQKPLALMERIILTATNKNEIILDCFSGAGTTAVAAHKHDRKWTLIDNNPEYNEIARKRLDD